MVTKISIFVNNENKIKILLIITAYLLYFIHDVQPHEHCISEFSSTFVQQICNNQLNVSSNIQNHEIHFEENCKSNQHELPAEHHHLLQLHDYFQLKTTQPTTQIPDYFDAFLIEFSQFSNENQNKIFIPKNEKICFSILLSSSLCLRAPPAFI